MKSGRLAACALAVLVLAACGGGGDAGEAGGGDSAVVETPAPVSPPAALPSAPAESMVVAPDAAIDTAADTTGT